MVALREQSARIGRPVHESPPLRDEVVKEWRQIKRQKQVRLTSNQVDNLIAAYLEGEPSRELATEFGVNESTVRAHLNRRNVSRRPYRKLHGERLAEAIHLYQDGASLRTVGNAAGVAPDTVRLALLAAGVTIRAQRIRRPE